MDTNELKQIVARHFDYAPHGTGQYLHGDWFTPKHKDSLHDLLEEVEREADNSEEVSSLESEVENLEEEVGKPNGQIEELEEQLEEAKA